MIGMRLKKCGLKDQACDWNVSLIIYIKTPDRSYYKNIFSLLNQNWFDCLFRDLCHFQWVLIVVIFIIPNIFIADGITYTFGIMYVEFLKEFNENKGYTSWILSLMSGMTLCSGNWPYAHTNLRIFFRDLTTNFDFITRKVQFRARSWIDMVAELLPLLVLYWPQPVLQLVFLHRTFSHLSSQ